MYVKVTTEDGKPVSSTNGFPVQLTGSKAQQKQVITLANALAITDTGIKFYYNGSWSGGAGAIANWNNYNRRMLFVLNSHDQSIDLSLISDMRGPGIYDFLFAGASNTQQKVTIPANGDFQPIMLTKADLPALDGIFADNVSMTLKASVAPTVGSITVKLVMWAE